LRQDLAGLGVIAETITPCDNLPPLATTADCYGCLYVLEGSTLGGQIICREVARRFPGKASEISRFFQPYGDRTGEMWTGFCTSLSDFGVSHPESQGQVIAAAEQTFLYFERRLQQ
jgi:heme oxygenase